MRPSDFFSWRFGFSLLAYASFGLSLSYLLGFLLNFERLPVTVDRGPSSPIHLALGIDVLLLLAFALQHSIMARPWFKRWLTKFVPSSIERSAYVLISSAVTMMLCLFWQPVPDLLWSVTSTGSRLSWYGFFAAGLVVLVAASFHIDHLELLGIKQAWSALRGDRVGSPGFSVRGFYRFVRHPIYVGWLMLFWVTPDMTLGHFLLAASMTVYVLVAIVFEERDLISELGEQYVKYRTRVPALLPKMTPDRRTEPRQSVKKTFIMLVAGGMLAGPASEYGHAAHRPGVEQLRIEHDGRSRQALLVVPVGDVEPSRIMVMLHGAGGNAQRIRLFTAYGLERPETSGGRIVVYPEGVGGTWNDCRVTPAYPAELHSVDDVGFLAELITRLRKRYSVAARDVLVAGFSNGGQMAIRLAVERPDSIGSIAVIAAQLPDENESQCDRDIPVLNSLWINGTEDPFIPWDGGPSHGASGDDLGKVESVTETIRSFYAAFPDVAPTSTRRLPEIDGDVSTWVTQHDWRSPAGIVLRQLVLHGSGHVVPQRETKMPEIVGPAAGDIDFGEAVAEFLDAQSAATVYSRRNVTEQATVRRDGT